MNFSLVLKSFKNGVSFQLKSLSIAEGVFIDSEEGVVEVEGKSTFDQTRIIFNAQGPEILPMSFSVLVDSADMAFEIPFLMTKQWAKSLALSDSTSAVLVKLTSNMETVELSDHGESYYLLDKNLNATNADGDWEYILFYGVTPGIKNMTYHFFDGKKSIRTIFLRSSEVIFY